MDNVTFSSSWPCEATNEVQPLAIRISRPFFDISPSVLGSSWWADVAWFAFAPISIYHLNWLPIMQKGEQESAEDFSLRVESSIAQKLGVKVTNLTHFDALEAAKRFLHSRSVSVPVKMKVTLDVQMLDDVAMRIKQSYPTVSLFDIRMDLENTRNQQATVERIQRGKLVPSSNFTGKVPSDRSQWKRVFVERKWALIERNRQRYLCRLNNHVAAGDQ
ncbi:CUE domain protein [Dictyocaulus viviparus]|uniref:CUE domain protein n=1 Tax=Dictyocaulus viviparus TaxID=29172 RepID=A0A0D8XZ04_DICVI|nr:CUE domain protein [Dictyocaulus viviparus]